MLKDLSLGESVKFQYKESFITFTKVLTKNENLTKVFAYLMQVEYKGNLVKFPLIENINEYEEKVKDYQIVKRSKLKRFEVNNLGEFIQ